MKSRDILSSVILIGAAVFVAATIFIKPGQHLGDFELYDKLAEIRQAANAEDAARANATPVRVYETPKALGDKLWAILNPKETSARFSGTGGELSLLRVSTGFGTEGNALLISDEFRHAADGALSGTDDGLRALLDYFDAAGGNETIIAFRSQLLLEALGKDSRVADSLTALQEATKNISEAAFTALWTGYIMPANFQPDFALPPGSIGYDLGAVMQQNGEINPVYDDFLRVPANSNHIEGSASDVESSRQMLWGDGVKGLTVFTAPIPNGTYKVYVLTSSEAGIDPSVAFGEYNTLRRDDRLRRVDLRDSHGNSRNWNEEACGQRDQVRIEQPVYNPDDVPAEQLAGDSGDACRRFAPGGGLATAEVLFGRQGISPEIEPELTMVSLVQDQTHGKGAVYALREEIKNGQLYIDFHQTGVPTYVVGIIVVAADDTFGAQMAALVSAVLETVRPAAGSSTQGPGYATNFAATTLPGGAPGNGPGGNSVSNPSGGLSTGPEASGGGDGDGDGDGGGTPPGDGTGGDGTGGTPGGDGDGTALLVAEGLGPYQALYGDPLTLDGRTSTINGQPIGDTIPPGLLVEWLFDIDGDGTLDLVSTDLLAQIDSAIFGSTGEFQGILRLTLDGLVSIDQVIIILFGPGAAIPEPGMLLLLALALGLLLLARNRRRTRTA
ncbi:PEP-CTERM sorting domain-containing protein [Emcibacter sp. SYSU 3D8]|uniref:PEP-CTERM sorting domain-containing protein n=1 Tax=Emcibacter sp. SYSU 3D8 TaxID=3133969 RepID=UPI0031FEB6A1